MGASIGQWGRYLCRICNNLVLHRLGLLTGGFMILGSLLVNSRHPGPGRVWTGGSGPHFWARIRLIRLIWLIRTIRLIWLTCLGFQNVRFGATLLHLLLILRKVTLWYNVCLIFSWTSQLETYS